MRRAPAVYVAVVLASATATAAATTNTTTYLLPYDTNIAVHPVQEEAVAATAVLEDPCQYGWNNNNSNPPACRGTLTEGCASYPKGPPCWDNGAAPRGAYGWINLGTMANTSAQCPPIPANGIGRLLGPDTPLYPASMAEALVPPAGSSLCFLACNITEVTRTGKDPCNAGSIKAGQPLPAWLLPPLQPLGSPEILPGPLVMNCYYGGKGWMKDPSMGMCGYNVTLRRPNGEFCGSDLQGCGLAIDPRRFPCCGGTPQCGTPGPSQPMCCGCKQDENLDLP